jgi:thiol-disulfide isomerase/thioredoxin
MVMAERASTPADDVEMHQALDSLLDIAFATRERFFEHLLDNWPHSYFARLVKANAAIDAAIPYGSAAALRAIDLADASLMRSSIYPKAVLAYLSLLETDRADTFVLAADSLIALAAPDTACHGYMVEQLVALFATHGPDLALRHVVEQHVLHDTRLPASLRTQAAALLEVATGGAGPDIRLPEPGGDTLLLSQLLPTHNWTLLFFYASDCGYCHEQMPPLVELHRADNGLGVVGIALDTDAGDFFDTLHDEGLPWPSFSELNGWRSQAAEAYKVNATPTLVLLDRERRVVARPRDAGELARLLSDLRH